MCDVAYQALSQLVQQWEGPGDEATAIPHAGDWLHVVPSSALGLHLHDQEFHHCLQ